MAWIHNHVINVEKLPYKFDINALGDFQIGAEFADVPYIKECIKEILAKQKQARWFGQQMWCSTGDFEDDDRPTTRNRKKSVFSDRPEVIRSSMRDHLKWIDAKIIPILLPLTEIPCLGALAGHHWGIISRNWNTCQYICNRLSKMGKYPVPYLGQMSAWIWLRLRYGIKHVARTVHIQHGVGGGQAIGYGLRKIDKTASRQEADAYIRAHDCRLEASKTDRIFPKDSEVKRELLSRTVPYLNIGSFSTAYNISKKDPEYPEQMMLSPLTMGYGTLRGVMKIATRKEDSSQNLVVKWRVEI